MIPHRLGISRDNDGNNGLLFQARRFLGCSCIAEGLASRAVQQRRLLIISPPTINWHYLGEGRSA